MRKIQKVICREELKSRIPALFAYIEENDAGEFKLHKATDSAQGCYGMIVENMAVSASLSVDGNAIISGDEVYSYRTIMNNYYQYKDDKEVVEANKPFFEFVDRAIGKIEIDLDELGLNEKDNDLVPHYIYLATARKLLNLYSRMKTVYDYYTGGYVGNTPSEFNINTLESDICCLCSKYVRMGGTVMYNKLIELADLAEGIASEYYEYVKDDDKIRIPLNIPIVQSIYDSGYLSCYLNPWVGGEEHYPGELYTYNGRTYLCKVQNHDKYNKETMLFEFDETKFELIEQTKNDPSGDDDYELEGYADSKLRSLRRFKNFINGDDEEESPDNDEDWLYFYREGLVVNYTTITDELGNIADVDKLKEDVVVAATDVNKLAAYGSVIESITPHPDNHTITFVYYLNVHLKASEHDDTEKDDDGNTIHKYDGFYMDRSDKYHGVKYTETYNYEAGGELDKLINGQIPNITFANYVKDLDSTYVDYNKYPFKVADSYVYYNKYLDTQIVTIPYVRSDYKATIKNETDYLFAEVYKTDYLNGISYRPAVENNVKIDRGNYTAFERHLKLGEVKTMEDMENYSNNSFFNVQKDS